MPPAYLRKRTESFAEFLPGKKFEMWFLVNRMRPLLNKIVDPAQIAFVPNRSITKNVVLAQEIVYSFKQTRKRKGYLGVKLDFQKAYDRME